MRPTFCVFSFSLLLHKICPANENNLSTAALDAGIDRIFFAMTERCGYISFASSLHHHVNGFLKLSTNLCSPNSCLKYFSISFDAAVAPGFLGAALFFKKLQPEMRCFLAGG